MNWIDQICDVTKESESPPKYFLWSAIASISAVLRDSVYINRGGFYDLYPNVFAVLIGPSGIKKGVPILLAKDLVAEANNTRILSGRLTIQKMISLLSIAETREGKGIIKEAHAFLAASEFASFIARNSEALTILTDLFDTYAHRKEPWINYTKKDDKEKLIRPCITLFGASNETHYKEIIPNNALNGGFIGRTFHILATESGKRNSLSRDMPPLPVKELAVKLKEISMLKGKFVWSTPAQEVYDKWYDDFGDVEKRDETGTTGRVSDAILKVAMIHNCAGPADLMLHEENIEFGIKTCEDTVIGTRKVTMGQGRNPIGPETAMVIRYLLKQDDYEATKEDILTTHWGHFDTFTFERIVETLTEAKHLIVSRGKYKLSEKIIKNAQTLDISDKPKKGRK